MGKRRKRTSSKVPAKGRLREMADSLWSLAIRADWNHQCAVCGAGKSESHHLVPRQHQATRYELRNGIALCARCHQFDPDISPHQNAWGWIDWLFKHHEELHDWYWAENSCRKRFAGTTNAAYYVEVIQGLRQYVEETDYVRIVGARFAAYLEAKELQT
jgi:hypothetical protein